MEQKIAAGKILIPVINSQKPSQVNLGANNLIWATEGIKKIKKIDEICLQELLL